MLDIMGIELSYVYEDIADFFDYLAIGSIYASSTFFAA
jgi:hypothetical protein